MRDQGFGSQGARAIKAQPVVIIGAPRSGTNMLRDSLARAPGIATWPCDEINYMWRHGNRNWPTDEFPPELARERVRRYIRGAFSRLAKNEGAQYVVEKTCANSLRVEFVDRVLPDARYIFIVRDGRDVVASAMKRWTAPLDLRYVLRKSHYVPLWDIPYYSTRYLINRLGRLRSKDGRLTLWGPRFHGMDSMAARASLPVLCAMQWIRCVERAEEALARLDPTRVYRVRYEEFVDRPADEIRRIGEFLGTSHSADEWRRCVADVSCMSVGKGRRDLDADQMSEVESLLQELLVRLGYEA